MKPNAIFWFRRDLRLYDNHGLFKILKNYKNVLPIFIFDPEILDKLPKDDARVNFIYNQLKHLNESLEKNQKINTYYDCPKKVFKKLIFEFPIEFVYTNHDYEPYAIARDKAIKSLLNEKKMINQGYLNAKLVRHHWKNCLNEKNSSHYKIWNVLMFQSWLESIK